MLATLLASPAVPLGRKTPILDAAAEKYPCDSTATPRIPRRLFLLRSKNAKAGADDAMPAAITPLIFDGLIIPTGEAASPDVISAVIQFFRLLGEVVSPSMRLTPSPAQPVALIAYAHGA